SLVPSQSELLWDLGLKDELVGITKFCIHPDEMFKSKTRIGGTKKIDFEKIEALKPDLIIGNKEENERADIELLQKKYPVWMSDINDFTDALAMIREVGRITAKEKEATQLLNAIKSKSERVFPNPFSGELSFKRVAYFIWKDPYMAAGENNYINSFLLLFLFGNAFDDSRFSKESFTNKNTRYPEITAKQLKEADPEIIFLSSEPYPFKEKHIEEFAEICPNAKIFIVDGEMFSWYGSRILKGLDYLGNLRLSLNT
ncbi:MAG: ABC transporter substrate-binding protein, partial [Bacteroidia bacterium]|nr:ABC transporter substrate-binding protein [Bacteroidia bacterium]